MKRWQYVGDMNIEHGGFFWRCLDWKHGFVEAVRVMPCSDAGAQDNCYWVETLTVILPGDKELPVVLRVCGFELEAGTGAIVDPGRGTEIAKAGTEAYRAAIVEACVAHGSYDIEQSTCISIGAPDPEYSGSEPVEPDIVLRANRSLKRYVRKCLRNV